MQSGQSESLAESALSLPPPLALARHPASLSPRKPSLNIIKGAQTLLPRLWF